MSKCVYDSREYNGGNLRPVEFQVYYDVDETGDLILTFSNKLHDLVSDIKSKCPNVLGTFGYQNFDGQNFNITRSSYGGFNTIEICIYSMNKGKSVYPKECFKKISRDEFLKKIIDFFDIVWKNFPEEAGNPSVTVKGISKATTTTSTSPTTIVPTTKTEGKTMNIDFNKIGKDIVSDNVEFARFEAERKIGQTALDVSVEAFCKQFPSFKNVADTGVGKLAIANLVRVLGNHYKGGNKNAVDMFTTAVMRGAYANAGDSIDLDAMLDGVVSKFKNLVPSMIEEKEK